MKYVGPEGPLNAKLAIVAEKPSHDELAQGRPLVGPTGQLLMHLLKRAGLQRNQVYLTNAVKHIDFVSNPTNAEIQREQPALFRELSNLPNLNCIVALGQSALVSLSNFVYNDITHRRGSVLKSFIRTKMVPTFHTSFIVRGNWKLQDIVVFDLMRAKEQSEFPEIRRPQRDYYINPTFDDVMDWFTICSKGEWLSFDLETRRAGPHHNWFITHWSMSNDPSIGYCVPLTTQNRRPYWTPSQEAKIWREIDKIVKIKDKRYVTQNGLNADCWWLYRHGVHCPYMSRGFDTMLGHRYLAADLPHSLEFLVSIYTDEEYYKDESGKHEDGEGGVTEEQYQLYACKDAALTLEVAFNEIKDLKELGMYDYYMSEKQSQWDVLFDMRRRGFHIDKEKKELHTSRLYSIINRSTERIKQTAGWVPNTKSTSDMAKLLSPYGVKFTTTKKTGKAKITEERLLTYAHQTPSSRPIIVDCLEITKQRTLLSNFLNLTTDPLDFYHASYDLSKAKTGRLASEGSDEGHCLPKNKKAGPQLQNVPRPLRDMFIADDPSTDELTSFDFTQAEPHVVAWLSQDIFYINALLSRKDVHRIAGTVIFHNYDTSSGVLPNDDLINKVTKFCQKCLSEGQTECTHSERYTAKRFKNAFNYRMGVKRGAALLRTVGVFLSEAEVNHIRNRCLTNALKQHWADVEHHLKFKSRWLTNIYGTKKEFYGQLDEKTLGDALSWEAQSAIAHLTCRAMRLAYDRFNTDGLSKRCRIVTQTHDSIVFNHPKSLRAYIHSVIDDITYLPTMVHGRELVIPYEVTHGPSWGEQNKCECDKQVLQNAIPNGGSNGSHPTIS